MTHIEARKASIRAGITTVSLLALLVWLAHSIH